jgi:hypothetical protein
MFDFVMHITRPDGTIPLLGDDDGGRSLALAARKYASYRDGLCTAAIVFARPDFKFQAAGFSEETVWLLGAGSWAAFNALAAQAPGELRHAFEDAGYVVQRSGWGKNDTVVTFDCGGLGIGSGGHSHADALSFTVFSGGHDFLIDPGTFVYNRAVQWRRYFRSTAAHNAVLVDNAGHCEPGASFRWQTRASARRGRQIASPEIDYAEAEVTAIEKRITHRRQMIRVQPNYWIVLDTLRGKGEHDFDFLYHFAPDAQLVVMSDEKRGEIDCRARIGHAGLQLYMFASEGVNAEAVCGQNEPIQGWASRLYGEHRASPVLKASVHAAVPVSMLSFVVPFLTRGSEPARCVRFKSNSNHATAVLIKDGEHDDLVVTALEDGELRFMDYVMRGEFFWLRTQQGSLRRLLAVNAYSFRFGGETVFEHNMAVPYVQAYVWENGIVIERGEKEGTVYVRDLRNRQLQSNTSG